MTMNQEDPQSDVFSLSDHLLAERLQFVKEIGYGNWGSVWLCRPKRPEVDHHVAVKLVHRSKTSTTAARVRSLWNEMKIVRSFKQDPHPSIIPFHSFIITPSYALITMAYLPTLVPVEVAEVKARDWFSSLLSGVKFLHERGVVHNDIKPANILLSKQSVPVLVDFGFAEKYDLKSSKAFHSNLAYGTPEYLSPERARGLPHDTRKSDLWSLGVTFFEILVGRTPFEYEEGEQFSTKEDLEKYWTRTMRGKWVGTIKVKLSKSVERLLKRMILPNADLRWTADQVLADEYWQINLARNGHKKSASVAHAVSPGVVLDRDISRLLDVSMPWRSAKGASATKDKKDTDHSQMPSTPSSLRRKLFDSTTSSDQHGANPAQIPLCGTRSPSSNDTSYNMHTMNTNNSLTKSKQITHDVENTAASSTTKVNIYGHSRSRSAPKLAIGAHAVPPKKRVNILGPIQGSPVGKENTSFEPNTPASIRAVNQEDSPRSVFSLNTLTRKPLGPRQPSIHKLKEKGNGPTGKGGDDECKSRARGALADSTISKNVNANDDRKGIARTANDKLVFAKEEVPQKEITDTPVRSDVKATDLAKLLSNRPGTATSGSERRGKDSVRDRMREWEHERERLRDMERMAELEREREEHESEHLSDSEPEELSFDAETEVDVVQKAEVTEAKFGVRAPAQVRVVTPLPCGSVKFSRSAELLSDLSSLPVAETLPRAGEQAVTGLKHSLRLSIDKGVRMYKSSALKQLRGRTTPGANQDVGGDGEERFSWEDVPVEAEPKSSKEEALDRLTMWQRNVENIVEDARLNFASSSTNSTPPPALPLSPVVMSRSSSRHYASENTSPIYQGNTSYCFGANTSRSSRFRKVLAANQIFPNDPEHEQGQDALHNGDRTRPSREGNPDLSTSFSAYVAGSERSGANASELLVYARIGHQYDGTSIPDIYSEERSGVPSVVPTIPTINVIAQTPPRIQRRATILSRSPQSHVKKHGSLGSDDDDLNLTGSPSKKRGKSKSSGNLFGRIQPVSKLEYELSREPVRTPSLRLSAVLDRSLFIAPQSPTFKDDVPSTPAGDRSVPPVDDLTSSPYHVEPYPQRKPLNDVPMLDTPDRRRVEGVYDRFLMAATGVKRVGLGYQSANIRPVQHTAPRVLEPKLGGANGTRSFRVFSSGRRVMPPPISSDDVWRPPSMDEMGYVVATPASRMDKENKENTATLVRRAIKAIVPSKTVSRRLSRNIVI